MVLPSGRSAKQRAAARANLAKARKARQKARVKAGEPAQSRSSRARDKIKLRGVSLKKAKTLNGKRIQKNSTAVKGIHEPHATSKRLDAQIALAKRNPEEVRGKRKTGAFAINQRRSRKY